MKLYCFETSRKSVNVKYGDVGTCVIKVGRFGTDGKICHLHEMTRWAFF